MAAMVSVALQLLRMPALFAVLKCALNLGYRPTSLYTLERNHSNVKYAESDLDASTM